MTGKSGLRSLLCAFMAVMVATGLVACRKEKTAIAPDVDDASDLPTMTTRDVETLISDSGYTRYKITAPLWLMYDNQTNSRWRFPDGLDIMKFDNDMKPDSRVVCDSATYFTNKKLWRLDGNVRMRNVAGDKFLTQQLFWDQNKGKIYSDSFIHIERSDRILEGFGFVSDEKMTRYSIARPSGIFPVPERNRNENSGKEPGPADSKAADTPEAEQTQAAPAPVTNARIAKGSPLEKAMRQKPGNTVGKTDKVQPEKLHRQNI